MLQHKVVAYIVRGDSLVAFVHENDENPLVGSGLQVPAGTVHDGEEPDEAVLREPFEETGLRGLRIVRRLGRDEVTWPNRPPHVRHFFHLTTTTLPRNGDTSRTMAERVFGVPRASVLQQSRRRGLRGDAVVVA